eukprot:COSAG02_NODE_745_length_17738_cov_18.178241_3_plen_122_part_00
MTAKGVPIDGKRSPHCYPQEESPFSLKEESIGRHGTPFYIKRSPMAPPTCHRHHRRCWVTHTIPYHTIRHAIVHTTITAAPALGGLREGGRGERDGGGRSTIYNYTTYNMSLYHSQSGDAQ